jgi:hypothetical protein
VLLLLGTFASQTILKTNTRIGLLRGKIHISPSKVLAVPTYHPSYVLRTGAVNEQKVINDMLLAFRTLWFMGRRPPNEPAHPEAKGLRVWERIMESEEI